MKLDPKILAMIVAVLFLAMWGGDVPPNPPGPGPDPIPDVDPDAVITADGPHVLVIEETADRGRLSPHHLTALFMVGSWCREKGIECRVWDEEIDNQETDDPFWANALALPRTSTPWIVVANRTGGFSGPLPETLDEIQALIEEYD